MRITGQTAHASAEVHRERCILCDAHISHSAPELPGYRTCRNCDLTWYSLQSAADYGIDKDSHGDWDKDYYGDDKVFSFHRTRRSAFEVIVNRLDILYPRKGRLLDIGTGLGVLILVAAKHGWSVEGVEPSTQAANWARKLTGAVIHQGLLEHLQLSLSHYDVVTMVDVLRAVPDMRNFLVHVRRLIRPGGLLVIRESNRQVLRRVTWCKEWLKGNSVGQSEAALRRGFDYQGFSPASLRYALTLIGLKENWVEPSPVFDERTAGVSSIVPQLKRWVGHTSSALHRVSGQRIIVSPNVLAFGRAPSERVPIAGWPAKTGAKQSL
jgi:ubiquinone/menaquinone biosynthesis C-methylase UbiE